MAITRADITGALKVLNAGNMKDRRAHLSTLLLTAHRPQDVAKALADLHTYPDWVSRLDLETAAADAIAAVVPVVPIPTASHRRSSGGAKKKKK